MKVDEFVNEVMDAGPPLYNLIFGNHINFPIVSCLEAMKPWLVITHFKRSTRPMQLAVIGSLEQFTGKFINQVQG
jgi:hypothetical protein